MAMGTYLKNALLGHSSRQAAMAMPASLEMGLSLTDPLPDGAGITEPPGAAGYARVNTSAVWSDAPVDGEIANAVDVDFPTATGAWGSIAYWFEVKETGDLLWYGELAEPKSVGSGDSFSFPAGELVKGIQDA